MTVTGQSKPLFAVPSGCLSQVWIPSLSPTDTEAANAQEFTTNLSRRSAQSADSFFGILERPFQKLHSQTLRP